MHNIKKFLQEDSGVVMVEYAMLAACIALVLAIAASSIGTSICASFKGLAFGLSQVPVGSLAALAC